MEGTVREVGPVATIIETDEAGLLNRHTHPEHQDAQRGGPLIASREDTSAARRVASPRDQQ